MDRFRSIIGRLEDHGWLVATDEALLTSSSSDAELTQALQGLISLCPTHAGQAVAVFDGSTFETDRLMILMDAAVDSFLRQQ